MMSNEACKVLNGVSENINQIFLELGVPQHLSGYNYLRVVVQKAVDAPDKRVRMCDGLYKEVAEIFDTTVVRVERSMRHAITVTWDSADVDVLHNYFGNTVSPYKGKPTNSEFICRIANIVREEYATSQVAQLKNQLDAMREELIDRLLCFNFVQYGDLLRAYKEALKNA